MKNTEIIALWRKTSKAGKTYFSGKDITGVELTGFYNINKSNGKAPVLRVYEKDDINNEVLPMWLNTSKSGVKYLSGKYNGKRVVGFINDKPKNEKAPYIRIYESDEQAKPTDKPKQQTFKEVYIEEGDKPF